MIKSFIFLLIFLHLPLAGATSASNHILSPLGDRYDNGYPEERYHLVLDKLIQIYSPVIEELGGTFHILRDWSDGAVNMWAFKLGNEHWLETPGGMARYSLIIEEAFLLSVCHELGHLLGGAPYKGGSEDTSLEGQADYFATKDCIADVLSGIVPYKNTKADDEVKAECALRPNFEICERTLEGALSLTSYYAELEKVSSPKISTPSANVVNKTLDVHPPAQCRLDTFLSGYRNNERPKCWYKN